LGATKIRWARHVLQYVVIKRWVTGERAETDEDAIRSELETQMRELMELTGQRKFPGHKTLDTDRGHWKLAFDHVDRRGIKYQVYCCPMRHWCQYKISCRLVTGPGFIELQRHGLHDKDSHDDDGSIKLKYDQFFFGSRSSQDRAYTVGRRAQQESVGPRQKPFRRNCSAASSALSRMCASKSQQHVDGFDLKDSFGSLHILCAPNLFSDLMRKHNDPQDAYHFSLFEFVVLGSQVCPERDIVRITGTTCAEKATAPLSFGIRLQPRACSTRFRPYIPRPSALAL
jgi:hypothetical protein